MKLFICLVLGISLFLNAQTPDEIVQKADQYRGEPSWGFELKIIDIQKEGKSDPKEVSNSTFRVASRKFETASRSLADFTGPKSEVGKKLLMDGPIFWMHLPNTQNIVRITPAQKLAGMASAADIASTNFGEDYTAKLVGSDTVMKKDCYKLKLQAKTDEVAYDSLLYWVEKSSFKPVKVEYYGASEKKIKTAFFREFKHAMGSEKVHELFMVNEDEPGHITRLIYSGMVVAEWPETIFTKENFKEVEVVLPKVKDIPVATAVEVSASDIVKQADTYRGEASWGFELKVVDFQKEGKGDPKEVSNNTFRVASRKFANANKALADFTGPKSEVGKKLLMDGPIFWMCLPNTKNPVRITPAQKLSGMATAADIANTNFGDDYEAKLLGEESVLRIPCYKLELTAKTTEVAYTKLIYWVNKNTMQPVRADYYGDAGKKLKMAFFRDVKAAIGGKKIHEMFLVNEDEPGHVTRMFYSNLSLQDWPETLFNKDTMSDADVTFQK